MACSGPNNAIRLYFVEGYPTDGAEDLLRANGRDLSVPYRIVTFVTWADGAPIPTPLVPQGIFVEEPAQPGPPIELPPRSLRLGETIGDRVDCRGIYAEPDMTCLDLDVFRRCGLALDTALPSDNAVGPAKNRCRRHRRR